MQQLQYVPNSTARNLIQRKAHTFGVFLPHLYGEFYSEVLRGMDHAAQEAHYQLLVSSSHSEHNDVETALKAVRGRVDGIILLSPFASEAELLQWFPKHLPMVLLHCDTTDLAVDAINIDNFGGAYAMTQHLIGLGHRRLAIFKGPATNYEARERYRGFHKALADNGISANPALEFEGEFTEETGYLAAKALLQQAPLPTALFSFNDSMIVGALGVFRAAGLRIPEDLAVAGFDDIPSVKYRHPPLTTVRVPIYEVGRKAVQRLLFAIEHQNQHARTQEVLPTQVMVRGSCGAKPLPAT